MSSVICRNRSPVCSIYWSHFALVFIIVSYFLIILRRQNRGLLLISILIACSFFKKYSWTRWHQFNIIFVIILFSPVTPITLRYAIKIQIIVFYQIFHFMLLMIMSKGRIWCADQSQCWISTCFLPVLGKAPIKRGQLAKFSVWGIIWFIHSLIFPIPPLNFVACLWTPSFKYNLLLSCGESTRLAVKAVGIITSPSAFIIIPYLSYSALINDLLSVCIHFDLQFLVSCPAYHIFVWTFPPLNLMELSSFCFPPALWLLLLSFCSVFFITPHYT